jgi:hypothetical protein
VPTPYNDDFFFWWSWLVKGMEDYPYIGIDFRAYLYILLPLGSAYKDIGMPKFLNISFFCIFA